MVTDTYSKMMPGMSMRSVLKSNDYDQDLAYLGWQQRPQEAPTDRENDLSPYRSGSAPPTVEGSLTAVGGFYESSGIAGLKKIGGQGFVTEEDLRADPAYVNYYYSNGNLNPRLPPPLLSKEDWRFSRRLQGGAGGGMAGCDGGEVGSVNRSLFSVQPGIGGKEDNGVEWGGDGLIGLPSLGLGTRKKSIAEMIQDDLNQGMSVSRHGSSRPASRNAFDDHPENSDTQFTHLRSGVNRQRAVSSVQDNIVSLSSSLTYASTLGGSLSRSSTPDPTLSARAPSPCLPPVGGGRVSSKTNPMASPNMNETSDLAASFSTMNLSANGHLDNNTHNNAKRKFNLHSTAMHKGEGGSPSHYLNVDNGNNSLYPEYGFSGYALSPSLPSMVGGPLGGGNLPPLFENAAAVSAMGLNGMDGMSLGGFALGPNMLEQAMELQNMGSRMGNQLPPGAPAYLPYLRSNEYATELDKEYMNNAYIDLLGAQKAYLGELLSPPKCQFTIPYVGKSNSTLNFGYYRDPAFGLGMSYPGSPMASPLFPNSPVGSGSPVKHNERSLRYGMRNLAGGNLLDESFASSLLDEFKSNKTKCFELSEITGHVVEFSSDQYGSRFIQQKLETASVEEKNMIFHEIKPQALSLMTDVFGNYVIQKFFEHGTASQIRELANELADHVLTLSLQMYGCRVIQKAVEVVDLDQQTQMVMELDGHIMRCVRDQNGNHVIQKCIECVPENAIQFIVLTFYDQVVTLSTHPYGCRVVQRVLEHCHDPKTQQIMMDEILNSVCMLAQDQYGNYVVQHVLEHGKPEERSSIIKKLTGQIVKMSQQKFASNVIEKCLTFGNPVERQILVNEMLCTTEENEPLQVLMKDQFANYVVQKILETCDDQQLEMILNRIKIHLNALKKYTYGKHIVARVEKLVAAGEKRISFMSLQAPQMA